MGNLTVLTVCIPRGVRTDDVIASVVRAIRADPSLRQHSAAIAVRLALLKPYPCPALPPRHPAPAPPRP